MTGGKQKTILLVEDEMITAMAEKMALEKYGYHVITALTGEAAVKMVKTTPAIDLVLMDINLGKGMDGTEAAAAILKKRDLPVVFLSSHMEPEVVEKTEKITSYGYVVKNSSITVLDASIKMAFKLFAAKITEKEKEAALRQSEATVRNKLKAILEPEGDISALNLGDIIDHETLQTMMEEFYRLTHIGIGIIDIYGKVLVGVGWQDICTKYHRVHPDTLKNCLVSDVILSKGVPAGTFKARHCKNNLWDIVTPIEVSGKHLGNIFLGQFFYEDEIPDEELFRSQARQYGFDETEYLAALHRVPHWSQETVEAAMTFYTKLAGMISSLSFSSIKLSRALYQKDIALRQFMESEEKYRILIENSHDIIFTLSTDGVFTFVSPSWTTLLGHPLDQVVGKPFQQFVHADDLAVCMTLLQKVIETGQRQEGVDAYRVRHTDGSWRWFIANVVPIKDAAGTVVGGEGIARDITEGKQAEDLIQNNLRFQQALMDAVPSPIFYKDADRVYIGGNKAFEQYIGLSRQQFIGKTVYDISPADLAERYDKADRELLESHGEQIYEASVVYADGIRHDVVFNKAAFTDAEGKVAGLIGVILDITERKQAEANGEMGREVLQILNQPDDLQVSIQRVLAAVKARTGFAAVGIRLRNGDDFPYFVQEGFSRDFLETENTLIERDAAGGVCRDKDGNVNLECTCGLIISGKTDPANSLFTAGGSFWTNDSFPILELPSAQDPRLHPRNRCMYQGYASMALVPIRMKEQIVGLLQLNDQRKGCFSPAIIEWLETIAAHIGEALMRKQAEAEIQRQLAEKEILLREVHHRIKNNIASIGGLISLRLKSVTNPEAAAVLQDALGQIDSMRILYDKLLLTKGYKAVPVKNYVESLAAAVVSLFPGLTKIKLEMGITDFKIDPKRLFPLGLIINELLTNKMKYAFIDRKTGSIKIDLSRKDNHVNLVIEDNGRGLPDGFDLENSSGFGLMLVKMLSQQLGGSFSIKKQKGTMCKVEFDI